jgi:hypothetical protein
MHAAQQMDNSDQKGDNCLAHDQFRPDLPDWFVVCEMTKGRTLVRWIAIISADTV